MRKIVALIIATILLASTISVLTHTANAIPTIISVQPSVTTTDTAGYPFTVNVDIANVNPADQVIGIQFRLQYDDTKLQFLSATEGPFMQSLPWNLHGTYVWAWSEVDPIYGPTVLVGILLLPDDNGFWAAFPSGSGTLMSITMKTLLHPGDIVSSPVTTPLTLVNNLIVNYDLNEVPHSLNNGVVEIYLPSTFPTIEVVPSPKTAVYGTPFTVEVVVNNLAAGWRTIAVQFRLLYDASILSVLNVVEGAFLKNYAWNLHGTLFLKSVDDDLAVYGPNILVGGLLNPDANGYWEKFPDGSGSLAKITFVPIYPMAPGDPAIETSLTLFASTPARSGTEIVNDDLEETSCTIHSGLVRIYSQAEMSLDPMTLNPVVGSEFSLNIDIAYLEADVRAVGVQFRVQYDDEFLQVMSVTEGPFMQDPAWNLEGTFFIPSVEVDPTYGPNVLVGILLLPDANGIWDAFPSGAGTLATINFKVISAHRCDQSPVVFDLTLVNTLIINDALDEIGHTLISPAVCTIPPTNIGDINFDGKVDMMDIGPIAHAFGSYPGHIRWDARCDVNCDGKIDMRDVGLAARNFGWHA